VPGRGLAGVKRTVERFGVPMKLEPGLDHGSKFSVVLPLSGPM